MPVLRADDDLLGALEKLNESGVHRALVLDGDRLVGQRLPLRAAAYGA